MKPTVLVILFVIVLLMSGCAQDPDGSWHPMWQPPGFVHRPWVPSVTCRTYDNWLTGNEVTRCY